MCEKFVNIRFIVRIEANVVKWLVAVYLFENVKMQIFSSDIYESGSISACLSVFLFTLSLFITSWIWRRYRNESYAFFCAKKE